MATTKSSKGLVLIATFRFKNSNAVIYKLRSNVPNKKGKIEGRDQVERNGQWYDCYEVSCNEEHICGCQSSGEQCKASRFKGKCSHRTFVQGLIDAKQVVATTSNPVESKVVPIKRDMLDVPLNGNKGFSLGIAV